MGIEVQLTKSGWEQINKYGEAAHIFYKASCGRKLTTDERKLILQSIDRLRRVGDDFRERRGFYNPIIPKNLQNEANAFIQSKAA